MPTIVQIIARPGVEPLLQELMHSSVATLRRDQLESKLSELGSEQPNQTLDEIVDANLLQSIGGEIGISTYGHKIGLLLEALNGGDIDETFRRVRRLTGSREHYELVRQGMTTRFFRSLIDKPGVGRLLICSPWVNPSGDDVATLRYAILQLTKRGHPTPEIHVLTRPMHKQYDKTGESLDPFRDLGATIYEHGRLHSKLYIREPGTSGGTLMAMVGSENLTRGNNLELGIQINGDDSLIRQLIAYFWELTSYD